MASSSSPSSSPSSSSSLPIIIPYGYSQMKCGYCHDPKGNTSQTFGFSAPSFSPEDYDALMVHGWSRSGNYIYVPMNHKTCCPQYIIRLRTMEFAPSSSQRKTWRKFQKLLTISENVADDSTTNTVSSNPENNNVNNSRPRITITMERASFTQEKFDLYKKYTVAIHRDKSNEIEASTFEGFLVHSPMNTWLKEQGLPSSDVDIPTPECPYGTFHQLYRSETGQLLAVGVQDILPSGMISVYFYYDPVYKHLSLGRCSALYEIEFCRKQGYPFYFMGYYVHSCTKMNYKRDYSPSEMLCPSTYTWVPVPQVLPLLDQYSFSPFIQPFVTVRGVIEEDMDAMVQEGFPRVHSNKLLSLKTTALEALISVGSNQLPLYGIDCSDYEGWEIRRDDQFLENLVYLLKLKLQGWEERVAALKDHGQVEEDSYDENGEINSPQIKSATSPSISFAEFSRYFPEKTQEFVYEVLKNIVQHGGKDIPLKYAIYFR